MSSDGSYVRYRRPFSTAGRPCNIDVVDDEWASDKLVDDNLEISRHEAAVAPLMEEGELDADAIVVSPTGNSSSAASNASERRRREEGWNDLALDQIDNNNSGNNMNAFHVGIGAAGAGAAPPPAVPADPGASAPRSSQT